MKKAFILAALIAVVCLLEFIILFTPKGEFSPDSETTVEMREQGIIADFSPNVKSMDSIIISVKDSNQEKICDIRFNQVIDDYKDYKYIMVASEGLGYAWLDINSRVQYNDRFLWCKLCNGRYIIIDYVDSHVFITFSYHQLKIGSALLILSVIVIILFAKIQKSRKLHTV